MPITVRNKDTISTTTAVLVPQEPGSPPQTAPQIVAPTEGPSEWVLLGTTSVCDQQGKIHFFWFWRTLRPEEKRPDYAAVAKRAQMHVVPEEGTD